jgi:peptidoglycan LD-endopeptidase LytH
VYVFTAQRGQQIELTLHRPGTRDTQLFAALYRRNEGDDAWRLVEPLRDGNSGATILVDTDATYRLELQPELLADIDYELIISRGGSLPFPVVDASTRDIGSVFGDARDAGAREHHGVDIFAARGTPVRAVMDGNVRNGNSERGGLHVWLSSGFGSASHYYAHLDDTAVASGERVAAGDVIGYVGNTGNARGTPPHLHYGIYLRGVGPVDPAPYIQAPPPRRG